MHYYEHHLGDYSAATAHLSWDEDMAYRRLICAYYHSEKPIPSDTKEACRLVRAQSPAQRKAVETVLREFFTLESDGWHQKRCDEEIARARDKSNKARGSANKRWGAKPSDSEGNASAMRSHTEGNAPNPNPNPNPNHSERATDETFEEMRKCGSLAVPLREAGVKVSSTHPTLVDWVKDGFTLENCLSAVAVAREAKPDGDIPANYLDRIIREPRKPKLAFVQPQINQPYRKARELP